MRISHPTRSLFSSSRISFTRTRLNAPPKPLAASFSSSSSSMADPNDLLAFSADDLMNYGFTREDMYTSELAGTVNFYECHVFLRHKSYKEWEARVEQDSLPKVLSTALRARRNDIPFKTQLTLIDGEQSDGDVLLFPQMIKYKGLTDADVAGFVEDVLVNGKPWASGVQETLTGSYIFVCAHANRDKRCGVCGPLLIEKLKKEIELQGLKDQVFVHACSHIGGHKFAGNLIIYTPDSEGKITGHWYGYVTTDDVPELLDHHITRGEIVERLWRGQMGASPEGSETGEQKPNGTEVKKTDKQEEATSQKTGENVGGCCQGAKGISCCMTASSEVHEKAGPGKLTSWVKSLEQRNVLTAAAVVGGVAAVSVAAYSYYRRSA